MIPSTLGAAVIFLVLIVPGALWQSWIGRLSPGVKRTALDEAVRTVLASAMAIAAALLITSGLWLRQLQDWAATPSEQPLPRGALLELWRTAGITVAIAAGGSWITAFIVVWRRSGHPFKHSIRSSTAMYNALHPKQLQGRSKSGKAPASTTLMTVQLGDGSIWNGEYLHFDVAPEAAMQHLVLKNPQVHGGVEALKLGLRKGQRDRVIIPFDSIETIQIAFAEHEPMPPSVVRDSSNARRYVGQARTDQSDHS